MTLGEKIRALRSGRNVSLRRLSEITGVSKTTLSDLENDIKNPSLETLEKVAHAFNLTAAKLLSDGESLEDPGEASKDASSDLMGSFSKSENLIRTLYRAKDKSAEELEDLAFFIDTYLSAKEKKGSGKK
jgi:transcriptional regulator with XRE-family HTH domain